MQLLYVLAIVFVAATAQELIEEYSEPQWESNYDNSYYHPRDLTRLRRDLSVDSKTGDITYDHKAGGGRAFGTLGQNDAGLFGKAGYERNIFNDGRGQLDARAYGTRTLGPAGDSSALGGALNWKNDHAAASLDVNRQIGGHTSWTAAGGGRWPVGKNGDFGLEGTYSHSNGMRDYGGRGVFNYRF